MEAACERNFELKGCKFDAAQEQLRPPRRVRVGLIQHHIVLPTDAPVLDQVWTSTRHHLESCDVPDPGFVVRNDRSSTDQRRAQPRWRHHRGGSHVWREHRLFSGGVE